MEDNLASFRPPFTIAPQSPLYYLYSQASLWRLSADSTVLEAPRFEAHRAQLRIDNQDQLSSFLLEFQSPFFFCIRSGVSRGDSMD